MTPATADAAPDQDVAAEQSLPPSSTEPLEVVDVGPAAPTLVFLNGMKGYTEPCGCTIDVKAGGIDRIVGYVDEVKGFGAPVRLFDGGNIWFEEPTVRENRREQDELKAHLLARSFKRLGVTHGVPGPNDFALGVDTYRALTKEAGLTPMAVNLTLGDAPLEGVVVEKMNGLDLGVIFAVDPARFEGIEGVSASPAKEAIAAAVASLEKEQVQAIVLVFQGTLSEAKKLTEQAPRIDFVVASAETKETDRVDTLGRSHVMQVFDQGRYIGLLKLYDPEGDQGDATYQNARSGSKADLDAVQSQISHVDASINKLPPAAPGEEPPMLLSLRQRLTALKAQEQALKNASVALPEGERAFIWRAVRMDEGYPEDASVKQEIATLNREIKRVNAGQDFALVPPVAGEPFYVGSNQCKSCHAEAYAFWEKTNHGHALNTLEIKEKDFDQNCVSCHVVGFEKPGGSVLGKLQYAAKLPVNDFAFEKDLRNVGCENCHGPGSEHMEAALFGKKGDPKQFISNQITEATCMQSCHVPEHSPRFDFDVYVKEITGPGHARKGS